MNQLATPHVLYILTKLELGGAQKVCLSLIQGLKNQGEKSSLISGSDGPLVEQAQELTTTYFLKSFKREVSFLGIWREFYTFIDMIRTIKKIHAQHKNLIVHTHSTKAGIMGRWAAWFAGVSVRIHTVHGFGFHDHQNKIIWFLMYLCELFTSIITTHFICVSKKDLGLGSRLFPGFAKKSSVIHAAIDWEKFYSVCAPGFAQGFAGDGKATPDKQPELSIKSATLDTTSFIIGTISCFKPQKNLFDLLQAFKQVHDRMTGKQNIELHIIGDGLQRKKIEDWISENNLKNQIKLLGWQANVAPIIKMWDLFAMSSLWEGLPCSIIEARLCKIPVVAYNVGGICEVIHDGKNGFLIPPGNWQLLAEKLALLIENQKLYAQFKEFHDNLWDFDNRVMVRKHQMLYRSLAQKYFCNL